MILYLILRTYFTSYINIHDKAFSLYIIAHFVCLASCSRYTRSRRAGHLSGPPFNIPPFHTVHNLAKAVDIRPLEPL